MAVALGRFCFRFLLANSLSEVFSTFIPVGGCRCTISIRVVRSGTASYAFLNDAPISDSTADAMTFFIILHTL